MSDQIKLRSPRFRVILGDPDLPDTWQVLEVQSIGRDTSRAETIFARNKWGKMLDQPILFQELSAWAALTRSAQIDLSWEQFHDTYIEVTSADDDDDEDDVVRPTPPVPGAGYL